MRIVDSSNKNAIEDRPNLSSRAEFGPWERGTIEFVRSQNCLVTLIEQKTQFLAAKQNEIYLHLCVSR